jgi:hypothetical protein
MTTENTPQPDHTSLLESVAAIRRTANDPEGLYRGRPDLQLAAELNVKTMLAHAGVEEPTSSQLAERRHNAQWNFAGSDVNLQIAETINMRSEMVAGLGEPALVERVADLRRQLGPETYDMLVEQAGESGIELTSAVRDDLNSLKLLAVRARYLDAYHASKPKP